MKNRTKYRIFWTSAIMLAFFALAYLIVPPLIPLNDLRPYFASAISAEVGAPVAINGNIKLSLLGYPMIAAGDVKFGNSNIKSVRFRISWAGIFDLSNAGIKSGIKVSGLSMDAANLAVPKLSKKIMVSDSTVRYGGKNYEILSGVMDGGKISAMLRTGRHKYNLEIENGIFKITNLNEGLKIDGQLRTDENGIVGAGGKFEIEAADINRWFGFENPKLAGRTKINMDFVWDGKGFFDFSNIKGTNGKADFSGRILLRHEEGGLVHKSIRLRANNADIDLSFLKARPDWIYDSDFNLNIAGNIKTPFSKIQNIKSLSVKMKSDSKNAAVVETLKADNENVSISMSGKITNGGAENMDIGIYRKTPERSVRCVFSGNKENWKCESWSIAENGGTAAGSLFVSEKDFQMIFNSENMKPDLKIFDRVKKLMGARNGNIEFVIGDMAGVLEDIDGNRRAEYVRKNTTLEGLGQDLPLPAAMLGARGNIAAVADDGGMSFSFAAPDWSMSIGKTGEFSINHTSARKLLSMMTGRDELPFVKPGIPVMITGKYQRPMATDIRIKIGDMVMKGIWNDGGITLDTDTLDIDALMDRTWWDKFEDNQYLAKSPLLTPFDFGINAAITADNIKIGGNVYAGFVYSLSSASQKMSITDSENGKMLLSIAKDRSKYKYLAQLNRFRVLGKLFGGASPVDFEDTTITAEADLQSEGLTAYDINRNMTGMVSASMDGGFILGLGTDDFYNNANRYGKMDADGALHKALLGGRTRVKEMDITGEYAGGNFRTTKPFLLNARHVDITGNFSLKNKVPSIRANLVLRGTSPLPKPVALAIDGVGRIYSLSDILRELDLDYLREFISTHDRF